MDPAVQEALARRNPCVFFDMTIGGAEVGRIKVAFSEGISNPHSA